LCQLLYAWAAESPFQLWQLWLFEVASLAEAADLVGAAWGPLPEAVQQAGGQWEGRNLRMSFLATPLKIFIRAPKAPITIIGISRTTLDCAANAAIHCTAANTSRIDACSGKKLREAREGKPDVHLGHIAVSQLSASHKHMKNIPQQGSPQTRLLHT